MEIGLESRTASPSPLTAYSQGAFHLLDDFFYAADSDLGLLYSVDTDRKSPVIRKKGIFDIQLSFFEETPDWMEFILECRQIIVQNSPDTGTFPSLFLNERMKSSLICPVVDKGHFFYIIQLNSLMEDHYGRQILRRTEELTFSSIELLRKNLQNEKHGSNTKPQE